MHHRAALETAVVAVKAEVAEGEAMATPSSPRVAAATRARTLLRIGLLSGRAGIATAGPCSRA